MLDLKFHHLGLATSKPDASKKIVEALGYAISDEVVDPLQNVKAVFCTKVNAPAIEIIYPHLQPGPLETILKAQTSSFYHLCYECQNIKQTVDTMKASGFRVIEVSPPKTAILFGNRQVAFYMVNGFGLVELLENLA